ncbi:hypothetical protein D5S18_33960 [Nocardia panacis]|uniref:Uridine kinase n=1 Tax=Nocardia panacis TaxID=2340916 RepID=A0A3A4K6T7_9NOCA|nr:hypothetical protein [Nocardia panacis]RJO68409.1 hypothetical protein D5S18_33960 [Nocardia panacis]
MRYVPITPDALVDTVVEAVRGIDGYVVVGVDGADAAEPVRVAERIAAALREPGRPAHTVAVRDFVRPASLRLEFGRTDELSYRTAWFDYAAVRREVVSALREHGRWLPALWDERTDRSARAATRTALPGTVLLVAGPMLLGRGLAFDHTLALAMSESALRRKTPESDRWTIPALLRHDAETTDTPTTFVRWEHPDRPALRVP